jgi:hypothetical protein
LHARKQIKPEKDWAGSGPTTETFRPEKIALNPSFSA